MPDIFTPNNSNTLKAKDKVQKPLHHIESNENHIHSLASFCTESSSFSFHAQDPGEKILLFLRRHFITNIGWIFFSFILTIIPLSIFFLGISVFDILNIAIPSTFIISIIVFYYLIVFAYALVNFLNWFYNVTIITDKRIVDVDYSNLLYHNVAITKLSQIEDVNYTKAGFLRSLFNYGDVFAQTAGGVSDHFDMLSIPQPEKIANIISDLLGGYHEH